MDPARHAFAPTPARPARAVPSIPERVAPRFFEAARLLLAAQPREPPARVLEIRARACQPPGFFREYASTLEVPRAVLVVDRERLERFAPEARRAAADA